MIRTALLLLVCGGLCSAEIHEHNGFGKELPHDKYIKVVSEADSPVQHVYVKSKDGVYVAMAMRKPKGNGPFPALIYFHGAPAGQGMEKMVSWSRGEPGSPVWERFLKEGYVVAIGDYRGVTTPRPSGTPAPPPQQPSPDQVTGADDAIAIVDYISKLPYVDPQNVTVYGVSLGGNILLNTVSRIKVHAAILGAPAAMGFLGAVVPPQPEGADPMDRFKNVRINEDLARDRIASIQTPILILVGTKDSLIGLDRILYDRLTKGGKPVRMDIYENGYHDFCIGPQGHVGLHLPLMDATLDALELTLKWVKNPN